MDKDSAKGLQHFFTIEHNGHEWTFFNEGNPLSPAVKDALHNLELDEQSFGKVLATIQKDIRPLKIEIRNQESGRLVSAPISRFHPYAKHPAVKALNHAGHLEYSIHFDEDGKIQFRPPNIRFRPDVYEPSVKVVFPTALNKTPAGESPRMTIEIFGTLKIDNKDDYKNILHTLALMHEKGLASETKDPNDAFENTWNGIMWQYLFPEDSIKIQCSFTYKNGGTIILNRKYFSKPIKEQTLLQTTDYLAPGGAANKERLREAYLSRITGENGQIIDQLEIRSFKDRKVFMREFFVCTKETDGAFVRQDPSTNRFAVEFFEKNGRFIAGQSYIAGNLIHDFDKLKFKSKIRYDANTHSVTKTYLDANDRLHSPNDGTYAETETSISTGVVMRRAHFCRGEFQFSEEISPEGHINRRTTVDGLIETQTVYNPQGKMISTTRIERLNHRAPLFTFDFEINEVIREDRDINVEAKLKITQKEYHPIRGELIKESVTSNNRTRTRYFKADGKTLLGKQSGRDNFTYSGQKVKINPEQAFNQAAKGKTSKSKAPENHPTNKEGPPGLSPEQA
jgi:hypothetical protein